MTEKHANWPINLPASIKVERRGEIALVTLNRPEKRNALSDEVVLGLTSLFSSIPADIKGVVLSGAGGNFTAGLDLNERRRSASASMTPSSIARFRSSPS
jgi:(methylthio)acryloyl-CoA hydratase